MPINPFEIYGQTDDIKKRLVRDYNFNHSQGDEYRPEDAERESLRLHVPFGKLNIIIYIIIACFITLGVRTIELQMAQGAQYREIAEGNRVRIQWIKPPRGLILDRNEKPLVENVPNFTLFVVPGDLPKDNTERVQVLSSVSKTLDLDEKVIQEKVDSYLTEVSKNDQKKITVYQPLMLAEHIDINHAIKLKIESNQLPGIAISAESGRKYLGGNVFSNILGYTGKINEAEQKSYLDKNYQADDVIGKVGVEKYYEDVLRGTYGRNHVEVDSMGKVKKVIASEQPQPGMNLILSIDKDYQNKLQQLLDDQVNRLQKTGGAAIALDPRNGEILALVTSPTYDNNVFSGGLTNEQYQQLIADPRQPLFNRPLSGEYPSGSTIKPLIASAALNEGNITPSTTVTSTGGIKIDKWFFPDWKAGGHGVTNLTKALSESVNTFFYAIGGGYEDIKGLGVEKIKEYADKFGFGKTLGIDMSGEATGFLPDKEWKERVKKESWYIGDTYHLAIGQGDLLVTPLQIANLTAIMANGGTFYQPHVVRSTIDPITHAVTYQNPQIIQEQILPKTSIQPVRQGLREGVLTGSSRSLQDLPVTSAGKTGTAQYSDDKTHAWFTGFAPYDNPEIVITVLIEGGGEGNAVALPVAKDFLTWYYGKR